MRSIVLIVLATLSVLALNVDDRAIKVTSLAKVKSTRAALIKYIWGASWASVAAKQPRSVDHNYAPQPEDALPAGVDNVRSIDRLDVSSSESTKNGAMEAVSSTAFIFYPAGRSVHKAVIVHHGHGCTLADTGDHPVHLELLIRKLVTAGYTVAAMRMPLYQSPSHCAPSRAHDKLFTIPLARGSATKFFMEPIARTVNYLVSQDRDVEEIDMVGLSGGGWTTTLYAAVDPRIIKSFPVAGTLPLYLRGDHYNHDLEQYFSATYSLAGYKDLYVLGAADAGRLQLQILNLHDDCCFGERQHMAGPLSFTEAVLDYERDVQNTLRRMQSGAFAVHVDESAQFHQISTEAIEKVILPVLAGGAPPAE